MSDDAAVPPAVVVVEPDPQRRRHLARALGPGTMTARSVDDASVQLASVSAADVRSGQTLDERTCPPVVVVSGPSIPLATAVSLRDVCPGSVVVAVHGRASTAELRAAMAAGIGDLLSDGAPTAQLRHAVRRAGVAVQMAAGPACLPTHPDESSLDASIGVGERAAAWSLPEGGLVAVLSPKGGTGGTTVAVNLALALAADVPTPPQGTPLAVVVDADLQFGDVALMCGVDPARSLASLARGPRDGAVIRPDATSVRRALVPIPESAVALLAAPVDPALADTLPAALVGDVLDVLTDLAPWVVVDLPTVIDDRVMETIDRAGTVLVVSSADPLAIKDARTLIDLLERLGVGGRWAVVCNAPSADPGVGVGGLEHHLGRRVAVSIPHDPAVPATVLRGRPLVLDAPAAPAARAVAALAATLRNPAGAGVPMVTPLRAMVDRFVGGAWFTRLAGG